MPATIRFVVWVLLNDSNRGRFHCRHGRRVSF